MAQVEHVDLTQVFDLGLAEELSEEEGEGRGPGQVDPIEEEERELSIIYTSPQEQDSGDVEGEQERFAAAQEAYDSGRFDEAAEVLEEVAPESRSTEELEMLGQAYRQMGRFGESAQALETALRQRPSPELARLLIANYDELDDQEAKDRVCERFSGWPDYGSALEACD